MSNKNSHFYVFGPYRFNSNERTIFGSDNTRLKLAPKECTGEAHEESFSASEQPSNLLS